MKAREDRTTGLPERDIRTTIVWISLGALIFIATCVKSDLNNAFDEQGQFPFLGLIIAIDSSAINGAGNMPPADVPQAIASVVDDDSIRVAWEAVGEDNMSGSATRYEIGYRTAPISDDDACEAAEEKLDPGVSETAGTMLNYQIDGLLTQTDYYFCVRAYDAQEARNTWILGDVTARINPAPADVSTASATGTAFDTVRLQWDAVGEDNLTGAATRYEIGYSTTAIDDDADCDAATLLDPGVVSVDAGTLITYDLTGLINQTTYHFCIRAYDAEDVGDSWTYGTLSATTPEGTAGWGPWGAFGACSHKCGGGTKTQTRTCDVKPDGCAGSTTNSVGCNTHGCPVEAHVTDFTGQSHSLNCSSGYHVTSIDCRPGHTSFEGFDFWGPLACGAISRGGVDITTHEVSKPGVNTSTGTCNMSKAIGPSVLANKCEIYIGIPGRNVHTWTGPGASRFFQSKYHSMTVNCQQTP